jgi:sugar lactone lactonase YvrE
MLAATPTSTGGGFDLIAGEPFAPGVVALVTPDGSARQVADGLAFPNGMLIIPVDRTLIVAESYAKRLTAFDIDADGGVSNRRVWADLGEGVPDSICADAENAVWYADVPNKRCVRSRQGGEVLDAVELERACFACAVGGADGATLFMVANEWRGPANMLQGRDTQVLMTQAPAPRAGPSDPRLLPAGRRLKDGKGNRDELADA